ncbi:uncharacterized protein LOC117335931 [Pecten maximus]|uniref:uncharacterized protein LOC117335931 n=1 Tax=Pecten maximus TaxID=6579 RepID=UPI001458B69D|nr:uncharacterized protein LOC117335931 [Pecten maximus]
MDDHTDNTHQVTELSEATHTSQPRVRTLTPKAKELYEDAVQSHNKFYEDMWIELDSHLRRVKGEGRKLDLDSLIDLERNIRECTGSLDKLQSSFFEYLKRKNTEESLELLDNQSLRWHSHTLVIDQSIKELGTCMERAEKQKSIEPALSSRQSSAGSSSKNSSVISVIARKKAKAEAQKARLQYAEQEAALKKRQARLELESARASAAAKLEKADLEADLDLLTQKKEVAAAEAEAEALEDSEEFNLTHNHDRIKAIPKFDTQQRTRAYVEETVFHDHSAELPVTADPHLHLPMNPNAPVFTTATNTDTSIAMDLTRFLLKKDLLLSRLTNFDDRPESYQTWKSSFKSIMADLNVTPRDEMDLLEKWCGPESKRHVVSLKASNFGFPERGLLRVWERLDERFGAPEMIEASLRQRLASFPKLTPRDTKKLFDLSDLASEIESLKEDSQYKSLLGYFDSSTGVSPIVSKLPHNLQERWTNAAIKFTKTHHVAFPPFSFFSEFLRDLSKVKNNPSFTYDQPNGSKNDKTVQRNPQERKNISVRKTNADSIQNSDRNRKTCFLHNVSSHTLNKCRAFLTMSMEERKKLLRDKKVCFRCCESTSHISRNCDVKQPCSECNSARHCTALHLEHQSNSGSLEYGEEPASLVSKSPVQVNCTQICGNKFKGKSCAKIVLVDAFHQDRPTDRIRLYAMIDDQSNMSLAKSQLFDQLGIKGKQHNYVLSSVSGVSKTTGRDSTKVIVEPVDRSISLDIPILLECDRVPEIRDEIPTPEVAENYAHLRDVAKCIPPIDNTAHILMLIGRDVIRAHHVLDQRIGPSNTPYAQKLPLGWVIIGETCLGRTRIPELVNVCKTNFLADGRPSLFKPCPNEFECIYDANRSLKELDVLGKHVFHRTKEDEKVSMSQEDRRFLGIMKEELVKGNDGKWIAPLPFRDPRPRLTNNRTQAVKRARTLDTSLRKNPVKRQHFVDFMEKIFSSGHAELAPALKDSEECWYLPIFGVYHPRKPEQLRAVFDSSARHNGVSLNDVLMSGPDLANSLLGVLMRFRRESVAIVGDIEQMFYCFQVREDHRNYLRFLWYKDNNPENELVEYRMCVHVFGNSPSPAIATLGLRKSAEGNDDDVSDFVTNDFYVDDGLTSLPTVDEAVDLMKRTQHALHQGGKLRLHKIASNSDEVMNSFPADDLAKGVKDLDLGCEPLPVQCSLGVSWSLETDSFLYQVSTEAKPYTRRGILSTVNGIFDPLGFLAPVVIDGKHFLRSLIHGTKDWDEPLPAEHRIQWELWRDSLEHLQHVRIPRTYAQFSFKLSIDSTVHVFSDASEKAIAAVSYLHTKDGNGKQDIGFILGKAKVAPLHGHTIPRLELCAAVLAVDIAETVSDHLHIPLEKFRFHTDSKVVLGYIYNKTRRFYTYVANRVERIIHVTDADQWSYVQTDRNPADEGTRSVPAQAIQDSMWLNGPTRLTTINDMTSEHVFDLHEPEDDKEVRPQVQSLKTDVKQSPLGSHRFARFSTWRTLIRAIMTLTHVAQSIVSKSECRGWHICSKDRSVAAYHKAEQFVVKEVQKEAYPEELNSLERDQLLPNGSSILSLNAFLDQDGILRVGGRLNQSHVQQNEMNPIIIPGKHHVALLLVRLFHEQVKHQGRNFTEGAVRTAGYWITGCKRLVSTVLHACVKCRKLRGKLEHQLMADIPSDRLQPGPPFTNVGVDTFGPWQIVSRRTRGGSAQAKRWAIMFTCLTTRAIHIEVIEELSSSSFINAFRRFTAVRGHVKQIRSDRGTNFIGAVDDLQINAFKVEEEAVKTFLYDRGTTWLFNPPHASHMGGAWERMIGVSRRVLESMLTTVMDTNLTHEVLVTFLAEVCAIVNARPLVPVSSDPEDPFPISPATLLTQKPDSIIEPFVPLDNSSLHKAQWKRVKVLADTFWKRWRAQYLHTLQPRRKWNDKRKNIAIGDIVLLRDKEVSRNNWPLGYVARVFPSNDGLVRTAEVKITSGQGKPVLYVRPINELILLLGDNKG